MHIQKLSLKNFRCFESFDVNFTAPLILISGANGSGKTTLLEILHYCCYLRSFRTHVVNELPTFNHSSFHIKADITAHDGFNHTITIGVENKKKLVKVDQKTITTYKELTQLYRAITLTEDDLLLVKGSPEIRRSWIDQACSLVNPEHVTTLRHYRKLVQQRNALLHTNFDMDSYTIWTERLLDMSSVIRSERNELLKTFQVYVNKLLDTYFASECTISLTYKEKRVSESQLIHQERAMRRSMIGAHLDDIAISFKHNHARSFASRGQQKLVTLLLKISELQHLSSLGFDALLLLDDFMTDFDTKRIDILLNVLDNLNTQIICTSPTIDGYLERTLLGRGAQHIKLTD